MAVADASIIEWKVKEGEQVEEKQVVVVIETEKLRYDVESPAAGLVHILLNNDDTAPVGSAIGMIAATKEELETLQKATPAEAPSTVAEAKEIPQPAEAPPAAAPSVSASGGGERVKISPVARKMAEEHVIDITKVSGTGPGGRITREDIEKAIADKAAGLKEVATPAGAPGEKRVKSTVPLRGMRGAIAEHMHRSLSVSAQLTAMGEIDMTQLVKLRQDLVEQESTLGTRITYTDLLVLAVARALKENPVINASLIDNEIKIWEDINIGVAVALEEGLIVPVVSAADKKSLKEISQTVKALAAKAREGKLQPEEISGGTFTVSNLGAVGAGYRFETVIINQPESAILGTGAITDRAVVRDGQIVIRPIMTYYLTYDHRVIDGAVAAKFMADVIKLLENPYRLLISTE
jgi:pyruvate dehydrogenase E2 component (dihydrolipoamide acetyltransferase)/2-oxoglutarate dehydrogenase E2 component (dihydrolipoamide succinyltransferase)